MKYTLVKRDSDYRYSWKDLTESGQKYMEKRIRKLLKKELAKEYDMSQIKKDVNMARRKGYSPIVYCEADIEVELSCDTPYFVWWIYVSIATEDYVEHVIPGCMMLQGENKECFINIHQTRAENAEAKKFIANEKDYMQHKNAKKA